MQDMRVSEIEKERQVIRGKAIWGILEKLCLCPGAHFLIIRDYISATITRVDTSTQ